MIGPIHMESGMVPDRWLGLIAIVPLATAAVSPFPISLPFGISAARKIYRCRRSGRSLIESPSSSGLLEEECDPPIPPTIGEIPVGDELV
jgi:hypothetical protein